MCEEDILCSISRLFLFKKMFDQDTSTSQQQFNNADTVRDSCAPSPINAGVRVNSNVTMAELNDAMASNALEKKGENGQLLTATQSIGGFKASLNKLKGMISSILEEGSDSNVKNLLSLRGSYKKAYEKCTRAIRDFCSVLENDSPRFLDYSCQLKDMEQDYHGMQGQIDQCLVKMVEVASSTHSSRTCNSGRALSRNKGKPGASACQSSAGSFAADKQVNVKLKELQLEQVKMELRLKERAAQMEAERVVLRAEMELARAQIWAGSELQEDNMSQCFVCDGGSVNDF